MSIAALIKHVRDNGFDITLDDKGPRLKPIAPKPVISRETVEELKEHRQAIIDYITAEQSPKAKPTAQATPQTQWDNMETCETCLASVDRNALRDCAGMIGICPHPQGLSKKTGRCPMMPRYSKQRSVPNYSSGE